MINKDKKHYEEQKINDSDLLIQSLPIIIQENYRLEGIGLSLRNYHDCSMVSTYNYKYTFFLIVISRNKTNKLFTILLNIGL